MHTCRYNLQKFNMNKIIPMYLVKTIKYIYKITTDFQHII